MALAKLLQFPDGKVLKTVRRSTPSGLDVIRYFDDPDVRLETLKIVFKVIAPKFRRRLAEADEHEWSY